MKKCTGLIFHYFLSDVYKHIIICLYKMLSFLFSHPTIEKADFEDIKYAIQKPTAVVSFAADGSAKGEGAILINTLPSHEQDILIQCTIHSSEEERTINELLNSYSCDPNEISIIVYGKNANDPTVERKYYQLKKLGFPRVYVYYGGMFEWALLNELYGADEFPTTQKIRDILKFKSSHSAIISKYKMLKY